MKLLWTWLCWILRRASTINTYIFPYSFLSLHRFEWNLFKKKNHDGNFIRDWIWKLLKSAGYQKKKKKTKLIQSEWDELLYYEELKAFDLSAKYRRSHLISFDVIVFNRWCLYFSLMFLSQICSVHILFIWCTQWKVSEQLYEPRQKEGKKKARHLISSFSWFR